MKKISVLLASLLVVACASTIPIDDNKGSKISDKPTSTPTAAPVTNSAAPSTVDSSALSTKIAETAQSADVKQKPQTETPTPQIESAYFDFDKYVVKPEFQNLLEKIATILKVENMKVVLEGNTDERGSAEYNMVLGLKRAEAVEKSLVTFGVSKSQIKVVSYGKSRPKMNCHEEKCWHENRRVDFVPQ
jgi:peptidoglycan-associated lipoprotein